MARKREKRKRIIKERRKDEEALYYVLERDLDREAVFPEHDGWYSQISFGKGKRIDYVIKYGSRLYGIEVKKGIPSPEHFEQAKKYSTALNGVFLAYPSDRIGEANYISEIEENKFGDIGLISLTLFRSYITRKTKKFERKSEQIWNEMFLDNKEYLNYLDEIGWENSDRLPATILEDGCFWVSFTKNYEKSEELYRLIFRPIDWRGLAVLYGASFATSLHRFFSKNDLWKRYCKELKWKSFRLYKLVQCNLAVMRSYGNLLWMYSLSGSALFLRKKICAILKEKLGKKTWDDLKEKIHEWKNKHREKQIKYEKEFAIIN